MITDAVGTILFPRVAEGNDNSIVLTPFIFKTTIHNNSNFNFNFFSRRVVNNTDLYIRIQRCNCYINTTFGIHHFFKWLEHNI